MSPKSTFKKQAKPSQGEAKQPRKPMSQGLLIAIISAAATVVAALLTFIPDMINAVKPEPTATLVPTFTATLIPPTPTPTLIPTSTSTSAPTLTPTPEIGIFAVYLAQDAEGQNKTFSFAPTQTIYLFYQLNDPSGLNQVKIVWSAVDVQGYVAGAIIHQTEDVMRKESYSVQANKDPWDPGKYKVELYLNEILDETLEFEILK